MKLPSKDRIYVNKEDGSFWTIWDGQDLSDTEDILLYNKETGEDATYSLVALNNYFTEI